MIAYDVIINDDIFRAYDDLFDEYPRLVTRAFRGEIERVMGPAVDELSADPGPVKYPIRWKTERQRRAFFASGGFGRGIPTQRTGKALAAWELIIEGDGLDLSAALTNPVPYDIYIQGDYAQPFHLDTGYTQAAPVFVRYEEATIDALIDTWFAIVEFAGT